MNNKMIGKVDNPDRIDKTVTVSKMILILGSAAVIAYVGFNIGGPVGAAVGLLIGFFVGSLSAGLIKLFKVHLHPKGVVEIMYETVF